MYYILFSVVAVLVMIVSMIVIYKNLERNFKLRLHDINNDFDVAISRGLIEVNNRSKEYIDEQLDQFKNDINDCLDEVKKLAEEKIEEEHKEVIKSLIGTNTNLLTYFTQRENSLEEKTEKLIEDTFYKLRDDLFENLKVPFAEEISKALRELMIEEPIKPVNVFSADTFAKGEEQ